MLYYLGTSLHRLLKVKGEYFPFQITGFEYDMIGVSLFGSAYGMNHIGKIAIVDFGQEMFIWFLYIALLIQKRDSSSEPGKMLKLFAKSPVIIAIFANILLNPMGIPNTCSFPFDSLTG